MEGYENCPVAKYHVYKVIDSPYKGGVGTKQIEQCTQCHSLAVYSIDATGEAQPKREYFLNHIRDFCQPFKEDPAMYKAFQYCHPELLKKMEAEADGTREQEEWRQEMSEVFKWTWKKAMKNEDWEYVDSRGVDRSSTDVKKRKQMN